MKPQIDFRIPGISHTAVEQEVNCRTQLTKSPVYQIKNHPNKDAYIADLQNDYPYNPLRERSKEIDDSY